MHTVGVNVKSCSDLIKAIKLSSLFSLHISSNLLPEVGQIAKRLFLELKLNI